MTLIEELLDIQTPNDVRISPSCQQVLYSTTLPNGFKKGEHDLSTLWLADTGCSKSSRQLTSGLYCDHMPRWSPDGKTIAFISDRSKQGEQWAIYMLPAKSGGEAYPLTPTDNERSIEHFEFSQDGKFIAYISADEKSAEKKAKEKDKDDAKVWGEDWPYNRLRIVHIATKKVTTLASHDGHVKSLAWNDNGTKIAFTEVQTPDIESPNYSTKICIVHISSRRVEEVCMFPNSTADLIWTNDSMYFIGAVTPETTITAKMVYSIDLKGEPTTYTPCAHGKEDCARGLGKAGKDVTVFVQHDLEDQIRMLNGKTLFSRESEISAWDAAFTTDSDEMILAIAQGHTNSSAEVFTTTPSGGAMVQLSNHSHAFEDREYGTPHFLRCQSGDDDVALNAVYITPGNSKEKPAKPLPTVVSIHGGPYGRVTDNFNPASFMWSPLLLEAGYGILLPNYRGGSGRGEDFAAAVRGNCGIKEYEDVITLTNHAVEEGFAGKERLLVSGWSQGGFLSFISSVRNGMHPHGWKFKAAIPGAGITEGDTMTLTSDLGSTFEADLAGKAPWDSDEGDTSGRTGSAIWEFKAAADKGVIPPMLILHGEKDARVPLEQSVGFRRALESRGLPFEMVVYPREPHVIKERKHLVDMAERVLRFVDVHIGGVKS